MSQLRARNTVRIQVNDLVSYIALFIAFYWATNGELRYPEEGDVITYYLPFVVCLGALLFELMSRRIAVSSYLIWRVLLALFLLITMVYAAGFDAAFASMKQFILQSVVVVLIALKCSDNPVNIKRIMLVAIAACAATTLYIASNVDLQGLDGRLGTSTFNKAWNANNIGSMCSFAALLTFCVFFVFTKKVTRRNLILAVVLMLAFGYVMILSGSRKSVLVILVTGLLYMMRSQKSKRVSRLMLTAVVLVLAVYAIYNVPFLYQNVGVRFEGALDALFGDGGDKSAQIRQEMIDFGLELFREKPIFGHGLDSFSVLWSIEKHTKAQAYAHNNYVEWLVTGGIVGFGLYYGYIARMLTFKTISNKHMAFIKGMLVAFLIADVGSVSYLDPFLQYVLCLTIYSIIYASALDKMYTAEQLPENAAFGGRRWSRR